MPQISKKLQDKLIHHLKLDESKEKKRTHLHEKIVNKLAKDKANELDKNSDGHVQGSEKYKMVRSKTVKGADGYGKVISESRSRLIDKLGRDPGKDIVAMHEEPGDHKFDKNGGKAKFGTRSQNTADSNRFRKGKNK